MASLNNRVIKFVAGGGKTTMAGDILNSKPDGLYLAFTNSVINDMLGRGFLGKTVDSFFQGYIIPKFISTIPIIENGAHIEYTGISESIPAHLRGCTKITIDGDGKLYFNRRIINGITMDTPNFKLSSNSNFQTKLLKYIFGNDKLRINDDQRSGISQYILRRYPDKIIDIMKSRFSYVIFDEAQDLKAFRRSFAELLYKSDMEIILLGDDNQNISGGDGWFESLPATEFKTTSYRCPDDNCDWIRKNLHINIQGNSDPGGYVEIKMSEASILDDGHRTLLFCAKNGKELPEIVDAWKGPKETVKTAKGQTIDGDIVIVGKTMNKKNLYTAITRTRAKVYSSIKLPK